MTSYEGLFLATGRAEEGARCCCAAAGTVSEGMLANTADSGTPEYNTVDAHALVPARRRPPRRRGPATSTWPPSWPPALDGIVAQHIAGTRFGIGVDPADGLLRQGAEASR